MVHGAQLCFCRLRLRGEEWEGSLDYPECTPEASWSRDERDKLGDEGADVSAGGDNDTEDCQAWLAGNRGAREEGIVHASERVKREGEGEQGLCELVPPILSKSRQGHFVAVQGHGLASIEEGMRGSRYSPAATPPAVAAAFGTDMEGSCDGSDHPKPDQAARSELRSSTQRPRRGQRMGLAAAGARGLGGGEGAEGTGLRRGLHKGGPAADEDGDESQRLHALADIAELLGEVGEDGQAGHQGECRSETVQASPLKRVGTPSVCAPSSLPHPFTIFTGAAAPLHRAAVSGACVVRLVYAVILYTIYRCAWCISSFVQCTVHSATSGEEA